MNNFEISNFPNKFDNEKNLCTVKDNSFSYLSNQIDYNSYDWKNGNGIIEVSNINIWPSAGFVTIYLTGNYLNAKERSTLFYYNNKNENSLINVQYVSGKNDFIYPENSLCIQNVVAQNHNSLKNAILNIENYLGTMEGENENTLSWFSKYYIKKVKSPLSCFKVNPSSAYINDEIEIYDKTQRIDNNDYSVKWKFDLGDKTLYYVSRNEQTGKYLFKKIITLSNGNKREIEIESDTWDGIIIHKYEKYGKYNISLEVQNRYGKDKLEINEAVKIYDNSLLDVDIEINSKNYTNNVHKVLASEDSVKFKGIPVFNKNLMPVIIKDYVWNFGSEINKEQLLNSPILEVYFTYGGIYDVGLKVISETGSWAAKKINNIIDVIEKPSVWNAYNELTSNQFKFNEYSILSKSWKFNKIEYDLGKNINEINKRDNNNHINYLYDCGFHNKLNTNDVYILYSKNKTTISFTLYNVFLDVYETLNDFEKSFNWYSLYMPVSYDDRIYVLGGVLTKNDYKNIDQRIRYYEISTNTFIDINVSSIYRKPNENEEVSNEPSNVSYARTNIDFTTNPQNKPAKWNSTNYRGNGYIFRNSNSGYIDIFAKFDPVNNTFNLESDSVPFSKTNISISALFNGIYILSNAGDIYRYDAISQSWLSSSLATSERYSELFHTKPGDNDKNLRIISGTETRTINTSNDTIYFSADYSVDNFGSFNTNNLTISKLPDRSVWLTESPRQFGMGVI